MSWRKREKGINKLEPIFGANGAAVWVWIRIWMRSPLDFGTWILDVFRHDMVPMKVKGRSSCIKKNILFFGYLECQFEAFRSWSRVLPFVPWLAGTRNAGTMGKGPSGEMAKRVRRILSIWRSEKGADYSSVLGWTIGLMLGECSSSILLCARSVIRKAISCLLLI